MSYNKKAHLRANIDAIKTVFILEREQRTVTDYEQDVLMQYSGFGGLKCVLNPVNSLADTAHWAKSELELFPMVAELHQVIKENTNSDQEYKQYFNSIKNSVLSAFYTPPLVVQTIADVFHENNIEANRILDPSAGMGEFSSTFSFRYLRAEIMNFEKDLLTGKMLSHINPDDKVIVEGFETIETRYNNYFDVVTSNIPFGEMSVFDAEFMKTDKLHRDATRAIHNYFFVKGVETLRDGGVLAFITSQGVLNSPNNQAVRKWLMDNTNLVSAVRLPNNLFIDNAGTEVGSDLIILQKNTNKQELSESEKKFLTINNQTSDIATNAYFENKDRTIYTKESIDTDPYGKPAQVFIHDGGINGIVTDLEKMLQSDFEQNMNLDLYNKNSITAQKTIISPKPQPTLEKQNPIELDTSQPVMSLYDLFGFTKEERTQIKPTKGKKSKSNSHTNPVQLSLFSKDKEEKKVPKEEAPKPSMDIRSYSGELKEYHKQGSLVEDLGQVGYLKERYRDGAEFQPLDIDFVQRAKISRYIEIRDTYHTLYNHEAKHLTEHASLRGNLNLVYDNFVKRYGNLNDKKNLDIFKLDTGGIQMLSLERSVDGIFEKADVFHKPVAFNPNEINHAETSHEALVASLNKYGEIRLEYMVSLLDGKQSNDIIQDLKGQIYFNPMAQNFEIRDKFIAGNVIEKEDQTKRYTLNHPDDKQAQISLKALQDAIPQPIRFAELDFNFGERWIPMQTYRDYASQLFETNVNIEYYASRDDFNVTANSSNLIIREKYAVQSESQLFTGVHLLKNALLNTTPNITKTIQVLDENGERKNVKVADSEAIQLANSKIDEIRNGFTDWLNEQTFVPDVEVYSIDEAFLDMSGFDLFGLHDYSLKITKAVTQATDIPVSMGIAPTKTLAKIANRFAKKYKAYNNVCIIDTDEKRIKALQKTDLSDVWGIGRQHAKKLKSYGCNTAFDFAQMSRAWVRKEMTVVGERMWRELNGEACIDLEMVTLPKKEICTSRAFGKMTEDINQLSEAVATYTSLCAQKLRKQKSCAQKMMVFIHTNNFKENEPQYFKNTVITLPVPTNSTPELVQYALAGLKNIYKKGYRYKKAGVILLDLIPDNAIQSNLFDNVDREKHAQIMKVMDNLNSGFNKNVLSLAIQGTQKREWKLKQEMLSPCYTTRINDVIKVKV